MADDRSNNLDETSEATMIVDTSILKKVHESQKTIRAYLIILSGPDVGKMYELEEDDYVLGRSVSATLRIHEAGISRQHVRISNRGADGVYIEDLGSANGTFINGDKINRTMQLRDGDKITLGSTTILKFTYHDQLEQSFQRKMYQAALCDSLTGAYNKKYFLDQLLKEFSFAQRHNSPLSLIMFDVDHFKRVNDTYGHLGGDEVLIRLSELTNESVRNEDIFARYGGEEFAVICRGVPMRQAAHLGDRLRRSVEQAKFVYNNQHMPITISVGVAGVPDIAVNSMQELIEAADVALYAAKNSGRNRVMLARKQ